MARAKFVKKARKDYLDNKIKKGDSYYWWKFNFSSVIHRQLNAPRRSQLTQSPFLSELYGIQDDISEMEFTEDVESELEEITGRVQELIDQAQESLDNMPEHLQESSASGETLRERVDALEDWHNELDSIETEIEDDTDQDKAEQIEIIGANIKDAECNL